MQYILLQDGGRGDEIRQGFEEDQQMRGRRAKASADIYLISPLPPLWVQSNCAASLHTKLSMTNNDFMASDASWVVANICMFVFAHMNGTERSHS